MKTLEQFKAEHNIAQIQFLQGKGRLFAKVGNTDVVISKECNMKEPLYVIPLTTKEGALVPNAVLIVNNAKVKVAFTI